MKHLINSEEDDVSHAQLAETNTDTHAQNKQPVTDWRKKNDKTETPKEQNEKPIK